MGSKLRRSILDIHCHDSVGFTLAVATLLLVLAAEVHAAAQKPATATLPACTKVSENSFHIC